MFHNKQTLAGNLTSDVTTKHTQGGSTIAKASIAVNRKFKSQTGEQKEETVFVDLTFFGRTAEIANQYLKKGSNILVDGRLTLEQWTAQDGSKRSKHSIAVEELRLGGNASGSASAAENNQNQNSSSSKPAQPQNHEEHYTEDIPEIDISEDEIPF